MSLGRVFFVALLVLGNGAVARHASGQSREIAPVRVNDEIEVKSGFKWYPGKVLQYANGVANVEFQWERLTRTGDFKLEDMRFPNGEGHWLLWSDKSGKFKVEARYVSRTATEVTIRKADGQEATVPIAMLNSKLRRDLAKTPITGEENKFDGAVPVRVGDQIQVKSFSTWYDGEVKEVTREGAVVQYKRGNFGDRTESFEFKDMRFPNGEGRWREWSDASGGFKIVARYISRDATHVTIRKEDQTDVRVEIARLSPALRKLLSDTQVITPRPKTAQFTVPAGLFEREPASTAASLESLSLNVSAPTTGSSVNLRTGGLAFSLPQGDSVSAVIPIGGEEQWIAIGTYGGRSRAAPAILHWASTVGKRSVKGPTLLADERVLAYSADQARLITAEVQGTWNVPVRFCSYRIRPGDKQAIPEMRWEIPKLKYATSSSAIQVKLVGKDRLLMGYGSSVSMWNLSNRTVEYAVNKLQRNRFWLSPDHQHFAVFDSRNSLCLHETDTGRRLARQTWEGFGFASACFSQDGRHLTAATSDGIKIWSLPEQKPVVELPLGGLSFNDDTPLSLLRGGWIVAGNQFYSIGLKLVVWRYDPSGVSLKRQELFGKEMLAVAMGGAMNQPKTVLVGVASVPHRDAIELMKKVDTEKLMMLRRGSKIRIEATGDPRVASGIRRAAQTNGWIEDPSSEIVLTGSASLGETQTRTYRITQFGGPGFGGTSEQTHSIQPWVQKVEIRYGEDSAWRTASGGVPSFVTASGEDSIGSELKKSSNPKYNLFENLKIPEKILYPKYQQGLGRTWITSKGFVDELK